MKNKLSLSLFALLFLLGCKSPVDNALVSKYYVCNGGESYEDPVIELQFKGDSLQAGYYWGTTDEFDIAREGYLPGFFVLPMEGFALQGDTLRFVLNSKTLPYFFSGPVALDIRSAQAAIDSGYYEWLQKSDLCKDSLAYKALLTPDSIVLKQWRPDVPHYWRKDRVFEWGEDWVFKSISLDSLEKFDRRMDEEDEVRNRARNYD